MRILFIGDIVGRSGRAIVLERLPGLVRDWKLDFVVINGENAAGGFGITETIYQELIDAGADAVTLGNHAWDQKEALVFIERAPRLIRPVNYPAGTPGRGAALIERQNGARVLVINAMGRVFMDPLDDPFAAVERELAACPLSAAADAIVVDIHCRGDQREAGDGPFLRRPRQPRGRHPHPCADRRPSDPAGRHRLHVRRRHDRRLRFASSAWTRTSRSAASCAEFPTSRFEPALGERRSVRARGRDRRRDRPRAPHRRRAPRRPPGGGAAGILGLTLFLRRSIL